MANELTIREAIDHLRAYHGRVVKPFERLAHVLDTAQQTIEHDLPAAQAEVERLTAVIVKLHEELPNVEAVSQAAAARIQKSEQAAQDAERESVARIEAATREIAQWVGGAETAARERLERLNSAFEARREALNAEIGALSTKKAELEEAIQAMRAKF